ncbi:probable thiopurine S-methyltransferase [Antedon mediterranea]|uniref:probable thiopurine S-methyltransferase n=1 Tax=Antedon mediterranea TaxID=105859 RepID=UPI003AF77195
MSTAVIRNAVDPSKTMSNNAKRRKMEEKYAISKKPSENGHKTNGEKECVLLKKNQFGDDSDGFMSNGDWKKRWDNQQTKFHKEVYHDILLSYYDAMLNNKTKCRFFVPLCGKSVDMKWLLDKGHSVVGCELVELGVQQFFREQDIEYTVEEIPNITNGKLYKGVKDDICIYTCDFFKINSATTGGKFDCIWDRGSLAAINPSDRNRYHDVILDLLEEDGRYLLDVFEVDHKKFAGPPNNFLKEDIHKLFEEKCNVEDLKRRDAMTKWQQEWNVDYFDECVYMLTFK